MLAQFGVGQVLWSLIWFSLVFLWIMLVFRVVGDIFRSRDMGGVAKALWLVFVMFLPYLGVFLYLILRGDKMAHHQLQAMEAQEQAVRQYIQRTAGTSPSPADELARLAEMRQSGLIDDAEFAALKAKVIG